MSDTSLQEVSLNEQADSLKENQQLDNQQPKSTSPLKPLMDKQGNKENMGEPQEAKVCVGSSTTSASPVKKQPSQPVVNDENTDPSATHTEMLDTQEPVKEPLQEITGGSEMGVSTNESEGSEEAGEDGEGEMDEDQLKEIDANLNLDTQPLSQDQSQIQNYDLDIDQPHKADLWESISPVKEMEEMEAMESPLSPQVPLPQEAEVADEGEEVDEQDTVEEGATMVEEDGEGESEDEIEEQQHSTPPKPTENSCVTDPVEPMEVVEYETPETLSEPTTTETLTTNMEQIQTDLYSQLSLDHENQSIYTEFGQMQTKTVMDGFFSALQETLSELKPKAPKEDPIQESDEEELKRKERAVIQAKKDLLALKHEQELKQKAEEEKRRLKQERQAELEKREKEERIKKHKERLRKDKQSTKEAESSSKMALRSLLKSTKTASQPTIQYNIKNVIKVDSHVLNYGTFLPGKLLGSILMVSNTSDQEQTVELSIDTQKSEHMVDAVIKQNSEFNYLKDLEKIYHQGTEDETDDPITYDPMDRFTNSEETYECWHIENPKTKELTKKITLKLGPQCEQEFIIVMRAPSTGNKEMLYAFLNLTLLNDDEYMEKLLKKRNPDNYDSALQAYKAKKMMQVMLCGIVDPPRLVCLRKLNATESGEKVVPIALKQQSGTQKFRIPFKNCSKKEADVEFSFIKISEANSSIENEFSMNEYLEFYCMPGTLKLGADASGIMNVMVKVHKDKIDRARAEGKVVSNSLLKLLVAKIAETNILYSFYVDVHLVDQ